MTRRRYDRFFDKGMRGWIIQHARRNYWRVASSMDLDDLIQEGFVTYARCRDRYDVEEKGHFMSLVKMAVTNHTTILAKQQSRLHEVAVSQLATPGQEDAFFEKRLGGELSEADMNLVLAQAPDAIKRLMAIVTSESGRRMMCKPAWRTRDGVRATNNDRLCRLLGISEQIDLEAWMREILA